MKKSELLSGDIVEFANGEFAMVLLNHRTYGYVVVYLNGKGFDPLDLWDEDLKDLGHYTSDIVKLHICSPGCLIVDAFNTNQIWQKELSRKKMTLEEIENALGYSVEIVKEH